MLSISFKKNFIFNIRVFEGLKKEYYCYFAVSSPEQYKATQLRQVRKKATVSILYM